MNKLKDCLSNMKARLNKSRIDGGIVWQKKINNILKKSIILIKFQLKDNQKKKININLWYLA